MTEKAYRPNPDPIKIVSVPRCIGCGVRAPWCTCGRGDYRTTTFTPVTTQATTDTRDLDPRFTPFLHTGQRIRVADGDFIRTGTVGITSGWRPAYLLMHRSNAIGSWDVLGPRDRITAVKIGRYYVGDALLLAHLNREIGLP